MVGILEKPVQEMGDHDIEAEHDCEKISDISASCVTLIPDPLWARTNDEVQRLAAEIMLNGLDKRRQIRMHELGTQLHDLMEKEIQECGFNETVKRDQLIRISKELKSVLGS